MSVPKSKRSDGQLTVFVKASNLASYTMEICSNEKNFPKHYRWCLTSKIVDAAVAICENLTLANAVFVQDKSDYLLRKEYQNKALASTYSLLTIMDIAYRRLKIDNDRIEFWTGLVIEVQNYIRSWKKSDGERYKTINIG